MNVLMQISDSFPFTASRDRFSGRSILGVSSIMLSPVARSIGRLSQPQPSTINFRASHDLRFRVEILHKRDGHPVPAPQHLGLIYSRRRVESTITPAASNQACGLFKCFLPVERIPIGILFEKSMAAPRVLQIRDLSSSTWSRHLPPAASWRPRFIAG